MDYLQFCNRFLTRLSIGGSERARFAAEEDDGRGRLTRDDGSEKRTRKEKKIRDSSAAQPSPQNDKIGPNSLGAEKFTSAECASRRL